MAHSIYLTSGLVFWLMSAMQIVSQTQAMRRHISAGSLLENLKQPGGASGDLEAQKKSQKMCHARLDIVFVLDGSASISDLEWREVKDFVMGLSVRFHLGDAATRVAVVQFAGKSRVECEFVKDGSNFVSLADCVNGIRKMNSHTRADLGLETAKDLLKHEAERYEESGEMAFHDKTDAQLVFMLADGDADEAAAREARAIEAMRERNYVFSLAVGEHASEPNLRALASASVGGNEFFYKINEFSDLDSMITPLLYVSCASQVIGLGQGTVDFNGSTHVAREVAQVQGEQCGNNCLSDVYFGVFADGRQTRQGFWEVADRWQLVATLGSQLQYQTDAKVLRKFVGSMRAMIDKILRSRDLVVDSETLTQLTQLRNAATSTEFVSLFNPLLLTAKDMVDVSEGYELIAEFRGLRQETLTIDLDHGADSLDLMRTKLALRMMSFMYNAKATENTSPLLHREMIEQMWTQWQNAWGVVRIFVKVNTQCNVDIPDNFPIGKNAKEKQRAFMMPRFQHLWSKCKKAVEFDTTEFPSTTIACARQDEHVDGADKDRDNLIRYLGCGESRIEEPPVYNGPRSSCSVDRRNRPWNKVLCDRGSDNCNLFGPFWAVYAGKMDQVFGKKTRDELRKQHYSTGTCHMQGSVPASADACGNAQMEGFKTMLNDSPMKYVYGSVPDLPVSLAAEFQHRGANRVGWGEGGKAWMMPHERPRDPGMAEVLREVRRGSTVVLMGYGYSGSGKTTTLIGDNSKGIDGVVSIYLKETSRYIADVKFTAFEVYGRMSAQDGSIVPDVGQGVWAYKPRKGVDTTEVGYAGKWSDFHSPSRGHVDFRRVSAALDQYTISMKRDLFSNDVEEEQDWAHDVQRILSEVEELRRKQSNFVKGVENRSGASVGAGAVKPQAHIRGTPNNPSSSRGTLFVLLDLAFKDGGSGTIAVVDLAGAEDPVVLAASFMKFLEAPEPPENAFTTESHGQRVLGQDICNGESSMNLISNHLQSLGDHKVMDGQLAECIAFKKLIVPCADQDEEDMPPECAKIKIHGAEKWFKPVLDRPTEEWVHKSSRTSTQKFRDFEWNYEDVSIEPIPVDVVLQALTGGEGGEGLGGTVHDSPPYRRMGVPGWNNGKTPGKPHGLPKIPASCSSGRGGIYKMNNTKEGSSRKCPVGICREIKLSRSGKVRKVYADLQLERTEIDLVSGAPTGMDWRLNRCVRSKGSDCLAVNDPPTAYSKMGVSLDTATCYWPDRLWHKDPYSIERQIFNEDNSTARRGRRQQQSAYDKYFAAATFTSDDRMAKSMVDKLGGDLIGDGKQPARLDYNLFLTRLIEVSGPTIEEKQVSRRIRMRSDFWLKLQEYIDEYKLHEEQFRKEWDEHMAYFTQVIGPMIEESIYINEMLNQMRSYMSAVSEWPKDPASNDPWPANSATANMGLPLGATQEIDADQPRKRSKTYDKHKYVQEKGAERSYYLQTQEQGVDKVMGLTMLETIRRRAIALGPEKYKILFGAFLRTDKPLGDPHCLGGRQSLEFAQILTEDMGKHRKDYLDGLLGPEAKRPAGHFKGGHGYDFNESAFAVHNGA